MLDIEELYKNYFTTIYKFLLCLTHDADLAEDLTQETFYKAIKNINQFQNNSKISVWLCSIAKNLYYDHYKKSKKYNSVNIDDIFNLESSEFTDNVLADQFFKDSTRDLNKEAKKVVYLRVVGNLTFKEISIILDKSEVWTRVTFYRCKEKMKGVDYYENEK